MLEFTAKELNKIQIVEQEINPDTFEHKGLPSDTHVVMYVVGGKTLYGVVRYRP